MFRSDASGRVTGVKGSRHKSYDTWEEALDGWRQNCRSYHRHGPDFVDGTLFQPQIQCNIPQAVNPPPLQQNIVSIPRSLRDFSPKDSFRPSPSRRNTPRPLSAGYSPEFTHRHWALSSAGFIGVVSRYVTYKYSNAQMTSVFLSLIQETSRQDFQRSNRRKSRSRYVRDFRLRRSPCLVQSIGRSLGNRTPSYTVLFS